ncbi:MAG: prolyl aminopeptidase [Fusobacterium sp.]|uniref:prolyl aminopeptidase n=1 Tax=Fusobacterium sp. TaxID=68766 RepID=UPI0026DB93E1|nr:prolyl aminopeptidase [Fusobacterium sp.]MDO4690263.1 prolyl aminopeptidase [Fusobacterium sp.]
MNTEFYPSIEPFKSYMLDVDSTHSIYVEECGNPNGEAIVFLHGGPGAGCGKKARRFFDPEFYHIILFDQRGCGRSKPFLCVENNTIFHLVEDMEKIRKHIGLEKWLLFGGSFGSTLALTYAFHHPERVKKMFLQGICLSNREDLLWFFQKGGLSEIYPDEFKKFESFIPVEERENMLKAYYKRIHLNEDEESRKTACKIWSDYELRVMESEMPPINPEILPHDLSLALIETHYFYNEMHWKDNNYILNNANKIKNIPCSIAHGRLDFNCRLYSAFKLTEKLENFELVVVEGAGHSPFSDKMSKVLIKFLEEYKVENER